MDILSVLGLSFNPSIEPSTSTSSVDHDSHESSETSDDSKMESPKSPENSELTDSSQENFDMSTSTIAELILNNPLPAKVSPQKRKGRSLAETVELLKRKKETSPAPKSASPRGMMFQNGPNVIPMFMMEHENAADRLAKIVSQEQEREIKNRIKALTNQIPLDCSTSPEDEKRFSCQICAKKFANKFLLNKHIFIHTGLRPHQCPDCHKSFNRKDNLLRHRKTHAQPASGVISKLVVPTSEQEDVSSACPKSLLMGLFTSTE